MKSVFFQNVVMLELYVITKRFTGEDELHKLGAFLVLDLVLDSADGIRRLALDGDYFVGEGSYINLHGVTELSL